MSDFLGVAGSGSLFVASLSKQTVDECGAGHLGYDGFFLFEVIEGQGINILAKAVSYEAALRLLGQLVPPVKRTIKSYSSKRSAQI